MYYEINIIYREAQVSQVTKNDNLAELDFRTEPIRIQIT